MSRRLLSSGVRWLRSGYGRLSQAFAGRDHRVVELSPNRNATFFGYYDKTPFSLDDDRVLGMNLRERSGQLADIGFFDLREGNKFQAFGETTTWSWQLGARLQWLPGNENDVVGYNRMVNGDFGFVLQSVRTGRVEAEYPVPVFDISPDGNHAISLNFTRLHRMRAGYGYGGSEDPTLGQLAPGNDGVVLLDLKRGTSKLLVSLNSLRDICPRESMKGAEHYVNHLEFSPSGKRFFFLHLWDNGSDRFSRPFTADIDGGNLFVLENRVNMSHHAWRTDQELLIHTSKHPSGTRFVLFKDQSSERRTIGEGVLRESGHPSYAPDGHRLVVDTYPDSTRRQSLYLCTSEGGLIELLGRFYSPPRFDGAMKCDLHPRWDRSGTRICIDSARSGTRAMYIIDVGPAA